MTTLDSTLDWHDLVSAPGAHDHMVQLYSESGFLVDAVTRFIGTGLRQGESAIVIAREANRKAFQDAFAREGLWPHPALKMLDADATLGRFMCERMPQWTAFRQACGGAIAELRLQYPKVRAYGEMVDILWQRGERNAAIRLEEFWNELGKLQTFSLLCAYEMDPLSAGAYGGGLESVCRTHSHLIPARSYADFNKAVSEAIGTTLESSLAAMLFKLAATQRPHTEMPVGQAALFWLKQNMPRTAERVLEQVRLRLQ